MKTLWQKAEEFSPTGIRTTTRGFRAVPPATDSLLYRGFFAAWKLSGPVQMSIHGYIALGLAGGVTLLLGGGLMWLAFYSANKGWDDIDRDGD